MAGNISVFREQFLQKLRATGLHLDKSREDFVGDYCVTLDRLVNTELSRSTGHRRILMGRKGVGKSVLLAELAQITRTLRPNVIVKQIRYGVQGCGPLPSQVILDLLKESISQSDPSRGDTVAEWNGKLPTADDGYELEDALKRAKKPVILLIDELPRVYLSGCTNGRLIISDLFNIGSDMSGLLHVVLTGSSPHFRRLVCGLMPLTEAQALGYGNYERLSLNSTKFVPFYIYPMLRIDDFRATCLALRVEPTDELYLQTGGLPRLIDNHKNRMRNPEVEYSLGTKGLLKNETSQERLVLEVLFETVEEQHLVSEIESGSGEAPYCFAALVKASDFRDKYKHSHSTLEAMLFDMADVGLIRYNYQHIGFVSPLAYMETWEHIAHVRKGLAAALLNPCGDNEDLAESFTLESVASCALKDSSLFGFSLTSAAVDPLILNKEKWMQRRNLGTVSVPQEKVLYKELDGTGKDRHGVDGAVLVRDGAGDWQVHRLQVKLGHTPIVLKATKGLDDTETIVRKLVGKTEQDTAFKMYRSCGIVLKEQMCYLVTTRQIASDALNHLLDNKIQVISKKKLLHVWPEYMYKLLPCLFSTCLKCDDVCTCVSLKQ